MKYLKKVSDLIIKLLTNNIDVNIITLKKMRDLKK